jgi:hypothetical protein
MRYTYSCKTVVNLDNGGSADERDEDCKGTNLDFTNWHSKTLELQRICPTHFVEDLLKIISLYRSGIGDI